MKQSFERYEKKYILTKLQASEMIAFLKGKMTLDRHHDPNNIVPYKIHSIYLDDKEARIIHKSLEKPSYKEKYRLRWYEDSTMMYLEVKTKYLKRSHKKRISINQKDSQQNDYHTLIKDAFNTSYLTSITHQPISRYCLIEYDRIAFDDEYHHLRITFDYDVSYTFDNVKTALFNHETVIMEIKYDQSLPRFITHYLSKHKFYSQSLSKIGLTHQQHKGATQCHSQFTGF